MKGTCIRPCFDLDLTSILVQRSLHIFYPWAFFVLGINQLVEKYVVKTRSAKSLTTGLESLFKITAYSLPINPRLSINSNRAKVREYMLQTWPGFCGETCNDIDLWYGNFYQGHSTYSTTFSHRDILCCWLLILVQSQCTPFNISNLWQWHLI